MKLVRDMGILDADDVDTVVYKVSKLVDDKTDFETALESYDLSKYLDEKSEEETPKKGKTGKKGIGADKSTDLSGVEKAFYAKHPNLKD